MSRPDGSLAAPALAAPSVPVAGTHPAHLTKMQVAILQALHSAGRELIAKQIAALAGQANSSRFRTVLRAMLVDGLVERGANGYRLPTP
jgi:hypothetical protein